MTHESTSSEGTYQTKVNGLLFPAKGSETCKQQSRNKSSIWADSFLSLTNFLPECHLDETLLSFVTHRNPRHSKHSLIRSHILCSHTSIPTGSNQRAEPGLWGAARALCQYPDKAELQVWELAASILWREMLLGPTVLPFSIRSLHLSI